MARTKKTADPAPELEIRADPEATEESKELKDDEKYERPSALKWTEKMMLRGLGLLPPTGDYIPARYFVSQNVMSSGIGGVALIEGEGEEIVIFTIPTDTNNRVDLFQADVDSLGWTGANIYHTGANIFDGVLLQGYYAFATGNFFSDSKWVCTDKLPCKPLTEYRAFANWPRCAKAGMTRWQGFVWYDENGARISTDNTQAAHLIDYTATSPANAYYCAFNIAGYPASSNSIRPEDVINLQIVETATMEEWSIDWSGEAGTVTDGVLDVTRGRLYTSSDTYEVTPVSFNLWDGVNQLWSDTGDVVRVEYSYEYII